jgi:hypothetical protein
MKVTSGASKRGKLPEQGVKNNHKTKKLASPRATIVIVFEALSTCVIQKRNGAMKQHEH